MTFSLVALIPFVLAVVLLALTFPRVAILLPLVLHPLFLLRASVGAFPTTALELLLAGVLLGVWGGSMLRRKTREMAAGISAQFGWLLVPLGLFLLAATVAATISPQPRAAWGVWKAMVAEPLAYVLTLSLFTRRAAERGRVILALLGGGLLTLAASLVFGGMGVDFQRFRGIYDVPNSLALVLAPLVTLALVLALLLPRGFPRLLSALAAGAMSLGLLATQSSAGVAAAALSLGSVGLRLSRVRSALLFCALLFGAAGVLWQQTSGKLPHALSPVSSSWIARREIWRVSALLLRDHPLAGVGLATFEPAYQQKLRDLLAAGDAFLSSPPLEWVVRDPHNIALSFWLQTGLLGVSAMLVLCVAGLAYWRRSLRAWARGEATADAAITIGGGSALAAVLLFGMLDVPYWKNDLALLFWVYLAVLLLGRRAGTPASPALPGA